MVNESLPVAIVKREDDPLLKRFDEIERYVGTNSESERIAEAAREWYKIRKREISETLMKAVANTVKGRRRFKVRTRSITFGSGKLAQEVLDLVIADLAATGYECDLKSNYLYFHPIRH